MSSAFELTLPQGVNHPEHEDWGREAFAAMPEAALIKLQARYALLGTATIGELNTELVIATAQDSVYRQHEEKVNSGYLVPKYGTQEDYHSLAVDPSRIAEYLAWFNAVAGKALESRAKNAPTKIGLELFGSASQWGDWGNTSPLDSLVQALPDIIRASGIDMDYMRFDKESLPADKPIKYRYRPHHPHAGDDPKEQTRSAIHYGTIERWRPEGDLTIPGQGVKKTDITHIFKRSRAVIALDLLDSRKERDALRIHDRVSPEEKQHALQVASGIFKRAIREPESTTIDTLPIGVHYVQMKRRNKSTPVEDV